MLTDWQNNLIDKYIRGDMTPEEKQSFERILENHEFREALEFRVATSEAIRYAGRDELRKELKTWRSNEKSGDKRISVRKVIGIAAVILVLISAGIRCVTTISFKSSFQLSISGVSSEYLIRNMISKHLA